MRKLTYKKLPVFIFLFVIAIIVYFAFFKVESRQNRLAIGKAIRQDFIQRVTIGGTVVPLRKTIITSPYNGYVKKLYVKVGQEVKPNDALVSIVQSLQSPENVFPMRTPFSGVVVQIPKSEGEFIKEGDTINYIMRIDDRSKLYVLASTPEVDRARIKEGQEAIVKASAILDRSYKGIIRELALAANEQEAWSRSQVIEYPVKIELLDFDEQIKSGMSVLIDIITNKKPQVVFLRHEFINRENEQYYVILKDGKRKNIKIGLQNDEGFEIIEGLNEGDEVSQVDFTQIKAGGN